MIDVNNFAYMKISLASPEKIRSWSYGEVKNQKLLTIELLNPKMMDYFVRKSLVQLRIGNVHAESTKE